MSPKSLKPLAAALALIVTAFAASAALGLDDDAATNAQQNSSTQPAQNSHPLDALDREVQKRFHEVIGFGMARIATQRRFAPETEEEKGAVRELNREGYKVGLYLAGRAILDDVPEQYRRAKLDFGSSSAGQAFSGPIFLSSADMKELPTAASLWDETRRALQSFATGAERYGFKSGEWDVETRPVRASEESCLKCHTARAHFAVVVVNEKGEKSVEPERKEDPPKLGDPLGVLVYAYRKRR
ncbi:MAG: hypothetical protein ACJ74Q_20605 [Pyrinomonadaceae bacterium]